MGASLRPLTGQSPIPLDKPIILIGRNETCDIALGDNSKVSRRHCCIVQCGERFLVRDLGSMNGVRVNSQRVVETELQPGDQVAVADVAFLFCRDEVVKKPVAAVPQQRPEATITTAPPGKGDSSEAPVPLPDAVESISPSHTYPEEGPLNDDAQHDEVRLKDDSQTGKFVSV